MGLSFDEYKQLSKDEMDHLNQQTADKFYQQGADLCVKNLLELAELLQEHTAIPQLIKQKNKFAIS